MAPIPSKERDKDGKKKPPTQFVSASLDGKLRIWCTERMIELYCFDIQIDSPV